MLDTQTIRSAEFTASRAWGALDIANMNGTTVRLHWTDQPYKWHVNDGEEVFAVMDGEVDMHYRENGEERIVRLTSGDIPVCELTNSPVSSWDPGIVAESLATRIHSGFDGTGRRLSCARGGRKSHNVCPSLTVFRPRAHAAVVLRGCEVLRHLRIRPKCGGL